MSDSLGHPTRRPTVGPSWANKVQSFDNIFDRFNRAVFDIMTYYFSDQNVAFEAVEKGGEVAKAFEDYFDHAIFAPACPSHSPAGSLAPTIASQRIIGSSAASRIVMSWELAPTS